MATVSELAWAAGFFDGEGSISACQDNKSGRRITVQMSLGQAGTTDSPPKSLARFAAIVGVGTVYPRKNSLNRFGRKPMWYWRASNVDDVKTAVRVLRPYLVQKLDQVAEAVALRNEWEGLYADRQQFCKRGHEFTADNIYTYENRLTPARLCRACARERMAALRTSRRVPRSSLAAVEGGG